jgi:fluoride exporter
MLRAGERPSYIPSMGIVLWIAAGGALGSALRHFVNVSAGRFLGAEFPWGTAIVNILGSFVMGVLISLMALKWSANQETRAFLTTGILGGFTTFSTFSLDFAALIERRAFDLAATYAVASVVLSLLAIFAGLWLTRAILQ